MGSKSESQADILPGGAPPPPRRARLRFVLSVVALTALLRFFFVLAPIVCHWSTNPAPHHHSAAAGVCPQESPLVPSKNGALWDELTASHATTAFRDRAVAQLSAAVQIPTETYDEMGPVGEDERWLSRGPFLEHLASAFPLVSANLPLQRVNTYGLIYTWQGSDASLKPILLMGHYDVVPVAPLSADQWTFPAYSGHFDGENIWGRGSSDDKSGVIGILTAIEVLLEKGFAPTRTVVLSFGFDEEGGGFHGAAHLGPALLERFGPDSFALIVDEGSGFTDTYGATFASPGVAEKGSVNVNIEIKTPGGHSSVPPAHTSIGMLAALIVHLEAHAPVPTLDVDTPAFAMAACLAAHAPAIPRKLRRAVLRAPKSERARKRAEKLLLEDTMFRALVGTTQAVDIVSGGVKSNALPEQALALVNHRIATQSSVNATITRDAQLVRDLAARFNLSVTAYGERLTPAADAAAAYGTLELSAPRGLEPAPVTPSDGSAYALLAATIRATFRAARSGKSKGVKEEKEEQIYVAPGLMTGNTDTRFNWELSKHIFRYGHGNLIGGGLGNIHTVNEHIKADAFVEMITFFTTLILNADEATAL
ncbi:carboxypeptidase S [Mycena albidolilacea]|uniref:Carboxypeptidase S n=1 Tax=Mycena albidolilacea TaxID=1033008 RepID=A0AAD6Z4L5_9AGAR|nr:carboxypeptidase S [Mycena albidolilacea]